MVLEASVIILDNSDWMRNGDYTPTRYAAQKDAVNLVYSAKLQSNPENTVACLAMAGKSPEMLVSLTNDVGQILSGLHKMKLGGSPNLEASIQIAQLALKHRANKNQRQRVVVFVGSPITTDEKSLVRIAKKLKKNNIAVDFVNFGEIAENQSKLEAFIASINSNDNSHLVSIPPGSHILSDLVRNSPIISGEEGGSTSYSGADQNDFEFGVDPNLDPELALALRMSMEEERARQAATTGPSSTSNAQSLASEKPNATSGSGKAPATAGHPEADEDAMLAQALALSTGGGNHDTTDMAMDDSTDMNEDEEIARAIALSMQQGGDDNAAASGSNMPDFMSSVISSLPGVDSNDPRLQDMMEDTPDEDDKEKAKKESKREQ
ncbi:proteasome regulatory particle base subunit rpn10 [Dimargaris cristalligena]|uniref:VWFA domain-containing protein n=1 Tax=Dimargaris cristalligena TaxID=215637 RepID=A0A4P9ZSX5_9FUNG|nr:proteasome regulatory particle base subunit rpn10 [Dimargaris cristalligena]RKP36298.1 hypothetical protein BJ085DRAFT_40707 [Dimargaris cristalligena]|eukprot:RKP36298.1 hypothetical protein BJ085DRAFT_40707 [Dimargaris cristalligena]